MDEKKSYLMNLQLEVLTDDGETVKAVHIHGIDNEPVPLQLWFDFLERLSRITPDGSMLFVGKRNERKPLVESGKGYVIRKTDGNFSTGEYFKGWSDFELMHCRSGEIVRVDRETIKDFICVGDYDKSMAEPVSPESIKLIERIKKLM